MAFVCIHLFLIVSRNLSIVHKIPTKLSGHAEQKSPPPWSTLESHVNRSLAAHVVLKPKIDNL